MKTYSDIHLSDNLDERLLDVCRALQCSPNALIAECLAAHLPTKEVEAACAPEVEILDHSARKVARAARARITDRVVPSLPRPVMPVLPRLTQRQPLAA